MQKAARANGAAEVNCAKQPEAKNAGRHGTCMIYVCRAACIVLLACILSLVSIVACNSPTPGTAPTSAFAGLCGAAQAEALHNIQIKDTPSDVFHSFYTIFEANGKLDSFTSNEHVFYVTNDSDVPVTICDIRFHVDAYYPLTSFFMLDTQECWDDLFYDVYRIDIAATLPAEYHGVKCQPNREPAQNPLTQIQAHGTEVVSVDYDIGEIGVYEGKLIFTFEVNGEYIEQVLQSDGEGDDSTSTLVNIPAYDYDNDTDGYRYYSFELPLEEMYPDEGDAKPLDASFACFDAVGRHLRQYYPNAAAYEQYLLDHYIPFLNGRFYP